ncbi:MAG: hypothetical protein CMH08_03350 [Marinovum sp.]|nr:hypothetical protein [Marinovum sp.]
MTHRIANEHKLPAQTDFDAVRLLRGKELIHLIAAILSIGFHRSKIKTSLHLPTMQRSSCHKKLEKATGTLPSTDVNPIDRRSKELLQIQLEITHRRRRKELMLLARLVVFVFLTTAVTASYFYLWKHRCIQPTLSF